MKIRFINARILTMKEGQDTFLGELWVDEDHLCWP